MDLTDVDWPQHGENERRAVLDAVESGIWWRNEGHLVARFEEQFRRVEGAAHVIGVTNGTHALELAFMASGLGIGDGIVLPALTFYSTLSAVQRQGAVPIIADVDPDNWTLSADAVSAAAADARAVVPVHFGGVPADLDAVFAAARNRELAVIQDAAHGPGLRPSSGRLGTFGGIACYSFQHSKLLPGGEGGAVTFTDDHVYQRALLIQNCGRAVHGGYAHSEIGSNFRMPEITGALLSAQLERWHELVRRRQQGADFFRALLSSVDGLTLQTPVSADDIQSHYLVQARLSDDSADDIQRDRVVSILQKEGIPISRVYPPLFDLPAYSNGPRPAFSAEESAERCPAAARISRTGVCFHHRLLLAPRHQLERVAGFVAEAVEAARR